MDGPGSAARWMGVAAAYTLAALLFLWPLPAALSTHVWGDRFDAWTTLWLIQHLHDRLAAGDLAARTQEILFPLGYDLWSFGHAALQLIGVLLMLVGVPLITAYNLLLVGAVATSGLAAHALGRRLEGSHLGGFVAGFTFCTSPYFYGEGAAGCIELVAAGLIPLFALTLVDLAREPGWKAALKAALVLAVVGPFNWYYTLFAGLFGLGFSAWNALVGRTRAAGWMLGAMALAAALDAPLIPLVRRETPTRPPVSAALFEDGEAWERAAEVSDGRLPLAELTVERAEEMDALQVGRNSTTVPALAQARFTVNPLESTPGALAFVVGLVGLAASGRRGLGWAILALGATVLTLGPFLRSDETPPLPGWAGDLPLPYYWAYQYAPFFSKAYRPYRIGVVTLLCLSALGAVGMAALGAELRRRWRALGVGLLGLLAASQPLWAGEKPAKRALADARIDTIYEQLRELPPGGVVEVPLQYQPLTIANARFQYSQIEHGHPVLNCNQLIRRTDLVAFRDYVVGNGFLSALVDLGRRGPPYRFSGADLAALVADGFRYVVVHTEVEQDLLGLAGDPASDLVGEPAMGMLERVLGAPVLRDASARVYRLPEAVNTETTWIFDGADLVEPDFPLDWNRLGLPLTFRSGQTLTLWSEPGTVSFWARPVSGQPPLLVDASGQARGLELREDGWTWVQAQAPAALLGAADGELALTRLQVRR